MPRRGRRARKREVARPAPKEFSRRAAVVCSLAVFAGVILVYLLTAIPTAIDQDSGELVAAAHVLGIAHPTGYPLWTLLGRGFDLLPVGHTSAYRVALLSAASAAAAAGLICWTAIALSGAPLPGLFAGLAFGLWFPTWSQAVRAEVYALEALLFALFLAALWRWERERSPRGLTWLALAGGFVAMHHRTGFLAAAPALATAFVLTQPRRVTHYAKAAFATPFLFYLYLPIRAAANPPLNWGKPDTWERFIAHVAGRQYAKWAFMNSWEMVVQQAGRLWGECLAGPGALSIALAAVGGALVVWGWSVWVRRRGAVFGPLAGGALLLSVWVLEWGDVSDSKVWLLPVGAALALFGGLGLARMGNVFPNRFAGRVAVGVMGAAVCGILLAANWARSDQSNVWRYRDQWAAALMQMDQNAIFVAEWDNPMFLTYYLQNVEQMRPDITLVRPLTLSEEWYRQTISDRELEETAARVWREARSQFQITAPGTPEVWEAVAVFAHELAKAYQGRRTVYLLHGPVMRTLPGPPWFVGLNDSLYRLSFERPEVVREAEGGAPTAQLPGGVELMSFQFDDVEVGTGELVGFFARWRLAGALPGVLFAVRLAPMGQETRSCPIENQALLSQGYPVAYGLWGLPASPPGTVYEQRGKLMAPSNLPAGEYGVEVGFAQSYPPEYGGWVAVEGARLRVRARALPENGSGGRFRLSGGRSATISAGSTAGR